MTLAKFSPNSAEEIRLKRLASYQILDTPSEPAYDELTRLASFICQASVAFISFVDADRQWNKSCYGSDIKEIPRHKSLCAHAIQGGSIFVIEDIATDHRFSHGKNPEGEAVNPSASQSAEPCKI